MLKLRCIITLIILVKKDLYQNFGSLMKICEKVLLEYLMIFITNNKILNEKQNGFITKLGCEINLA